MPVYATFYEGESVDTDAVAIVDWPDADIMAAFLQASTQDPAAFPFAWEAMVYHGEEAPDSDLPPSKRYSIVVEAVFPGMSMN